MKLGTSLLVLIALCLCACQGLAYRHALITTSSLDRLVNNRPRGVSSLRIVYDLRGGCIPAGWNPFGCKLSELGERFLASEGARECDVGRFLASFKSTLKSGRKSRSSVKSEWLEVLRYAKTEDSSRIYRTLEELLELCIAAGFLV